MENSKKLNVYAAVLFLVSGIINAIAFIFQLINLSTSISVNIYVFTSLASLIVETVVTVLLVKCLIRQESAKKLFTITVIWTVLGLSLIRCLVLVIVGVNTMPQFSSKKNFVNKFWFVPAALQLITTGILAILSGSLSIFYILFIICSLMATGAQLLLCKWMVSNPYDVQEAPPKPSNANGNKLPIIVIVIIIAIIAIIVSGKGSSSSHSSNSNNNSNKGGFYGSDGKYHYYVPEFGDDVNNWMENNW